MSDDYELVDSGDGRKLERFGRYLLARPCSQAMWRPSLSAAEWGRADATFDREDGNNWHGRANLPKEWQIETAGIKFKLGGTDFGHLGIFPEQRAQWRWIREKVSGLRFNVSGLRFNVSGLRFNVSGLRFNVSGSGSNPEPETLNPEPETLNPEPETLNPKPETLNPEPETLNPEPETLNPEPETLNSEPETLNPEPETLNPKPAPKVLNLFAYSGGSTMAAALGGAEVCHLDASKGMVEWARDNARLNGLADKPIRWIVDDAHKFMKREIRRGHRYDGIILDPPSFGRGAGGEMYKIERDLKETLGLVKDLLSEKPSFVLFSSHTPGLSVQVAENILGQLFPKAKLESGEMLLEPRNPKSETRNTKPFPCPSGIYCRAIF